MPEFTSSLSLDWGSVRDMLVVRRHSHIGDMLCSVPMYALLKERNPKARITLVTAPTSYPIPLHEINPYLDRILYYDKRSLKTLAGFYRTLWERRYQIALVPSTVALSRSAHVVAWLSRAPIRAGVRSIDGEANPAHRFLNVTTDVHWKREGVHQTQRNLDIAALVGLRTNIASQQRPSLVLSDEALSFASSFYASQPELKNGSLIGLHPGAGKTANMWPIEKCIAAARALHKQFGSAFLITAGPVDNPIIEPLVSALQKDAIPCVVLQNAPILHLAAVLQSLRLYITNDTGVMHVAGALRVPMIALFGPTDVDEWGWRYEQSAIIQPQTKDIRDITADDVLQAAERLLR